MLCWEETKEVVLQIFITLKTPLLLARFELTNLWSSGKHNNHYTAKNDFNYQTVIRIAFCTSFHSYSAYHVRKLHYCYMLLYHYSYYLIIMPVLCFVIPTLVPVYLWGETWTNSWFVVAMFRYTFTLNMTWLVNSAAHFWGNRPYDK
jgi:fatty-acid desaturase